MWAPVFFTFEVETRDGPKDLEPGGRVAPDFDLRFSRPKRVESLVKQIANDPRLRLIPSGADIPNRQVIVHAHVALDETGHLPRLRWPIEAFEDEDVAAGGGTSVALAAALMVRMRKRRADPHPQRFGVAGLGRADAIGETSFFHAASRRTA